MSFNYSDFNPSDYGLTKTDEKSGEDVINDGKGNYYKIDNFERQQNEDLDTDELGKSAGLQALAEQHTDFNVTSFNTANDVQGHCVTLPVLLAPIIADKAGMKQLKVATSVKMF